MDDLDKANLPEILERLKSIQSSTIPSSDSEEEEPKRFVSYKDDEGRLCVTESEEWPAIQAKLMLEKSGLADFVDHQTFDSFVTDTKLQKMMKDVASRYLEEILQRAGKHMDRNPWLYIGGNPGSGKTHICTAVCGELMKHNIDVKYMQWVLDSRALKFMDDPEEYELEIQKYVKPSVLYIDDFLKQKYADNPKFTEMDIKIAFSILNERYYKNKPTIISSEWDLTEQLMDADEAVFSRVYERSKGYMVMVDRKRSSNYRMTEARK